MNLNQPKFDGALLAARYAFMPNKLRYCGGGKNSDLFNYVTAGESDPGLKMILEEFVSMFPYLKFIARSNKIIDPFNYRVVEAYWLGNDLLNNVSMNDFYNYLKDDFRLKDKFKPKLLEKVWGKIPLGAKPHHSFHVFNIPKDPKHYPVKHTLETMDICRITPAKVKGRVQKGSEIIGKILVEYQPLVIEGNNLKLGEKTEKEVWSEFNDKAFVKELKIGDWVSLHWDWVCDLLTPQQAVNLNRWNKYNLTLFNI